MEKWIAFHDRNTLNPNPVNSCITGIFLYPLRTSNNQRFLEFTKRDQWYKIGWWVKGNTERSLFKLFLISIFYLFFFSFRLFPMTVRLRSLQNILICHDPYLHSILPTHFSVEVLENWLTISELRFFQKKKNPRISCVMEIDQETWDYEGNIIN